MVDWLGAALLSVATTSVVLVTSWGGTQYDWSSPAIIFLALLGAVTAVAFVMVERRVVEPILPLALFTNRNFAVSSGLGFFVGFTMFGATAFLPLYQQTVQGASATNSGLLLIPLMVGAMLMGIVSGQVITRTGHYRAFPIVGGALMTVGMLLLSTLDTDTTKVISALFMVLLGLGMGCLMQVTMLIAQNSVSQRDMGVASSTATFTRSIGGAFGVAIFGSLFTSRLTSGLAGSLPSGAGADLDVSSGQIDPATLDALPPAVHAGVLQAIADAPAASSGGPRSRRYWCSCSPGGSRPSRCVGVTTPPSSSRLR